MQAWMHALPLKWVTLLCLLHTHFCGYLPRSGLQTKVMHVLWKWRRCFFIITFWKTCSRCKKKCLKLDCSAHPETFPAGSEDIMRSTLNCICVFAKTYFLPGLGSVECWKKKEVLGCIFLTCQCPWRLFPHSSAGALALKMDRNVCIWSWMQQFFSHKVNFREIKSKCFMVQITQDSFTYSTLHIDMVVL